MAAWDDPGVDWAAFDLVVVIYTWGYVTRRERFLAWAVGGGRPQTALVNPEPVLRWNSDKAYLADLAAAGVPTVPTTCVRPARAWEPPARDYVVKPAVASGGDRSSALRGARASRRPASTSRDLHRRARPRSCSPTCRAVDGEGETALVFFGGRFSHARRASRALLEPDAGTIFGLWERQVVTPRAARPDQHAVAEGALRAVHERVGPGGVRARRRRRRRRRAARS